MCEGWGMHTAPQTLEATGCWSRPATTGQLPAPPHPYCSAVHGSPSTTGCLCSFKASVPYTVSYWHSFYELQISSSWIHWSYLTESLSLCTDFTYDFVTKNQGLPLYVLVRNFLSSWLHKTGKSSSWTPQGLHHSWNSHGHWGTFLFQKGADSCRTF